jgi:hypothetical protein
VLERLLLVGALGLDPAAVTYVGGDGVAAALVAEVDSGRAYGHELRGGHRSHQQCTGGAAADAAQEHLVHPQGTIGPGAR